MLVVVIAPLKELRSGFIAHSSVIFLICRRKNRGWSTRK